MHNDIEIVPLTLEPRDVKRFLNLSYSIYGDDPNWVAPLLSDLRKVFTSRNPLFEHAAMQLWIARRDGRDVGRIAGIHDRHHKEVSKEEGIFFGFFDVGGVGEIIRRIIHDLDPSWSRHIFCVDSIFCF